MTTPNASTLVPRTYPPVGSELGGITMSCGFCGRRASLDEFCETSISGPLPRNVFQCPACRRAVRKTYGAPKVHPSGFVMPGDVEMVEVESVL